MTVDHAIERRRAASSGAVRWARRHGHRDMNAAKSGQPGGAVPDLMTVDEVAAVLRISRKTLLNRRSAGDAPFGYRVGKAVVFPRDALYRYLEQLAERDTVGARCVSATS